MKKILTIWLIFIVSTVYGQLDNRLQPDSIYKNRKVKKIIAFLNSPKDLSEIIYFNPKGQITRKVKYSVSYNRKTRKRKRIDLISYYKYNFNDKLIQIIDSTIYWNNTFGINNTYFYYDSIGRLSVSKYFQRKFERPLYVTNYYYSPYKSVTIRQNDSMIVYRNSVEYEYDFYVYKSTGYTIEPKLKEGYFTNGTDTLRYQYSDYKDLQRFEQTETISNKYNASGQLVSSYVYQTFLIDRKFEYNLIYTYYSNGLLKSIRGYVPEFFKYEYYE
ncbi:hypothetical protein [Hugenholtzia roseola]|uniref:hypothetical protein n=1 Tax=Hugenholtzia roseola TaxID=1002 RepID=UPI00040A10CD|nr:hypothetical protein [Hugenholtzia roseola]